MTTDAQKIIYADGTSEKFALTFIGHTVIDKLILKDCRR